MQAQCGNVGLDPEERDWAWQDGVLQPVKRPNNLIQIKFTNLINVLKREVFQFHLAV